jgi:DMSO/TMAO reductase YedYZ heme-binding membrane subunit
MSKKARIRYLALGGLLALVLVAIIIALRPIGTPISVLTRAAALLGYLSVFATIVSSAYLLQIVKFFGRPFIKVHHIVAVTGLVLITLHPTGVLITRASLGIPLLSLTLGILGGPIAWALIAIAVSVALLRKKIGRNWRPIHYLNYLAFWLATLHANITGTDLQSTVIRVISIALAIAVIAVFVTVRRRTRKRKR